MNAEPMRPDGSPVTAEREGAGRPAGGGVAPESRPVGVFDLVERPELVVGVAFLGGIVLGRLVRALGR